MAKDLPPTRKDLTRQYRALLEVSESIAAHRNLRELFHELALSLHRVVRFEQMRLILYDAERNLMRVHILETPAPSRDPLDREELPVDESPGDGLGKCNSRW